MKILTAPVYTFFSLDFYRQVLRSSLTKAFLYLAYLAAIANLAALFFYFTQAAPVVKGLADWAAQEIPELTWTPEGLVMNGEGDHVMVHPDFGPLVVFNTSKTEVSEEEMGDYPVFVTRTRMYLRTAPDVIRSYDLTRPASSVRTDKLVIRVDGESVYKVYDALKFWMAAAVFFFFLPVFYLWKLVEILFFSLVGMLINLSRNPTLEYKAVLKLSFFAITPASLLQILAAVFPPLGAIPYGLFLSFLITTGYLIFAIKKTQGQAGDIPAY